jgi:hypothetical protein
LGQNALLAKIDILSVFRLMILHPDDFELFLLIVLETLIWGLVYCLKNTDKWWIIRQPEPPVFAFGTKPIGETHKFLK